MTEDLPYGFIAFYGKASKDGHAFPLNQNIQSIQQNKFNKASAWRGDIIVAKYTDAKFSNMQHISMADWPVLKNFFQTHYKPLSECVYFQDFQSGHHSIQCVFPTMVQMCGHYAILSGTMWAMPMTQSARVYQK